MRFAALMLVAVLSFGQGAKTEDRAKRVIDEAVQTLGGEKFLSMQDRVEQGRAYSFYNEQLSGLSRAKIYIRYLTRPEPPVAGFIGIRERQAFGKKEDVYTVFNETGGFEITYRGARPLDEPTTTRYRDTLLHNVLYTLRMRTGEPGLTFEYAGADIFENRPCDMVDIIDAANRITRVWFLQSSKLPAKQSWERRDPKTRIRNEEITIFDKYRDIGGGIMWPYVIRRERDGERIFEMYADSIAANQGLTDEMFTIPGDVKVLDGKSSNIRPGKK